MNDENGGYSLSTLVLLNKMLNIARLTDFFSNKPLDGATVKTLTLKTRITAKIRGRSRMIGSFLTSRACENKGFQSVVFNSGQKMVLAVVYLVLC